MESSRRVTIRQGAVHSGFFMVTQCRRHETDLADLGDGFARGLRKGLKKISTGEKTPTPPKNWKNEFVLKCFLGHFECFKQLFFLVENWAILTPSLAPP